MRRARITGQAAVNRAVNDLLNKFEYPNIGTGRGPVILGGGGGAPSIVIAASDASDATKAKADYVCAGVNDNLVVRQAAILLNGVNDGRILLTEGTYYFSATVTLSSGVSVIGMGMIATQIETVDVPAFSLVGFVNIRDLGVTTGGTTAGAINVTSGGVVHIADCLFQDSLYGINKSGSAFTFIERCYLYLDLTDGIRIASGAGETVISNNYILAGTGIDLLGTVNDNIAISGNYFVSDVNVAIQADTAVRLTITDNILDHVGQHGLSLTTVSESVIEGNLIYEPGTDTDNTYDGILLAGDSDGNLIFGNSIIPADSAGNQTRYGINISASTCDNNAVFANFLGDSSEYGTADSVDSGTGTILAASGGVIGGQFAY